MELPAYHAPSAGNVLRATWERGWSFIKRAGTVILLSSIVLWFLQGFGCVRTARFRHGGGQQRLPAGRHRQRRRLDLRSPGLVGIAWKAAVATVTGLIAKEERGRHLRRAVPLRRRASI